VSARFILIGCGIAKATSPRPALDLYTGALFRKARAYAATLGGPHGILSARHHVLDPAQVVEPYGERVERLAGESWVRWNHTVVAQLAGLTDPGDTIVALVGPAYLGWLDALERAGRKVEAPLATLSRPAMLRWLESRTVSA
jgi:hypothetical protein